MLTLSSSTIFVADMVIRFGRYGLFVWPMWLWPIWFVADMVQTRPVRTGNSFFDIRDPPHITHTYSFTAR